MSLKLGDYSGFVWPAEYTQEMFDILKQQEKQLRPIFMQSPQLHLRTGLLEWMKTVCLETRMNVLVFHLSVALLDNFMDNYDIQQYRLRMVAATCLLAAAKFEQSGVNMPTYVRIYAINAPDQEVPDIEVMMSIEEKVLEEYRWRLNLPTIATFVSFLLPLAIHPLDISPLMEERQEEVRMEMRDHLQLSLEKLIMDQRAMQLPRSMLAAACVMVARMELRLEPSWPDHLLHLTRYQTIQLLPALHLVLGYYRSFEMEVRENLPHNDSGYDSSMNSPNTSRSS